MPDSAFTPVDTNGAHPPYVLVRDALAHAIAAGTLPGGSRIPSERHLCTQFAVSRGTLRRALAELQELGAIEASERRGWQVKTAAFSHAAFAHTADGAALEGFTALNRDLGRAVTAQVLQSRNRRATSAEADLLAVAPGSTLFELCRLRHLDGLPVCLTHDLVPASVLPGLAAVDFTTASLFAQLAAAGHAPATARFAVRAAPATPQEAPPLDIAEREPVLRTVRTSLDAQGRPVAHTRETYRADRYELLLTLG
ncbi:GntR family transcriptional regulator [Streptomyces sp. NPDC101733]|uniref:GntR family transcriptional regulator n=1 Tax=unclassified Streptomyces TaxID=2593676 RepID=UPI0037F9F5FA